MRDFVIDPSTTGKDFFDLLTEEEATCVRGAVGDAIFQIILATPIMQGGSVEAAAPLFDCLEPDSVVMFSVAIDDFVAGGRSEETRACLTALSLKHPELTYMRLGLEWKGEDTAPTGERRSSSLEYMGCLTDAEGAAYVIQLYAAIDRESPLTGSDLVDLLSESEATCVRENLSEEQFNTLLAGTPSEGVRAAAPAAVCLSPDTIGAIFLAATEVVVGGFTEDTSICISNYVEQNPAFLPLVTSNLADLPAMPASSLWEIAEGNRAMLACFTEDEFVRVEDLILAAMRP